MSARRCDVCGGAGPFSLNGSACARCECADFAHAWGNVGAEIAESPGAWVECFRLAGLPVPKELAEAVAALAPRCEWCEGLGGNVTAGNLVAEWGHSRLALALADAVTRAGREHGGTAYLAKRDALAALTHPAHPVTGEPIANRGALLARFALGWSDPDFYSPGEHLLADLLPMLPDALLCAVACSAVEILEGREG